MRDLTTFTLRFVAPVLYYLCFRNGIRQQLDTQLSDVSKAEVKGAAGMYTGAFIEVVFVKTKMVILLYASVFHISVVPPVLNSPRFHATDILARYHVRTCSALCYSL